MIIFNCINLCVLQKVLIIIYVICYAGYNLSQIFIIHNSQYVLPAVSTRNLGVILTITLILENPVVRFVECVIIIIFVSTCLSLLQKLLQLH